MKQENNNTAEMLEKAAVTISVAFTAILTALMMWFFSSVHTQDVETKPDTTDTIEIKL